MKKLSLIVYTAIILLGSGCQKGEYPYISKSEVNNLFAIQNPAVQNVAFIYNNDVYYMADFDKPAQKVTNSIGLKKFVKMSHDHTKFAFMDGSNFIEVVDNKGKLITTITQYNQVKIFDWSADDKTLYILNNAQMVYYGPAMSLPITYPGIIAGYSTEVLSASVSVGGDFAYIIHAYAYSYGDVYKLVIKPAGSTAVIVYNNNDYPYSMNYVNFSSNKQDLVVGYRDATDVSYNFEKLDFFTELKANPDFSIQSSETYCTPVYKSNINYMVSGYTPNGSNKVTLLASYESDITKNKILTQYSSTGNGLYTDWK